MKKIIVALENNQFTLNGIVDVAERLDANSLVVAYSPRERPNIADLIGTNERISTYRQEPDAYHTYRFCKFIAEAPSEFQHILPVYVHTGVYDRVVGGYLVLVGTTFK